MTQTAGPACWMCCNTWLSLNTWEEKTSAFIRHHCPFPPSLILVRVRSRPYYLSIVMQTHVSVTSYTVPVPLSASIYLPMLHLFHLVSSPVPQLIYDLGRPLLRHLCLPLRSFDHRTAHYISLVAVLEFECSFFRIVHMEPFTVIIVSAPASLCGRNRWQRSGVGFFGW